jgi:hypothetical protein
MSPEPTAEEQERDRLVATHPDFILLKRFDFSLEKALKKHPEGLPENLVAQALGKTNAWVNRRYAVIVKKLKEMVHPEER